MRLMKLISRCNDPFTEVGLQLTFTFTLLQCYKNGSKYIMFQCQSVKKSKITFSIETNLYILAAKNLHLIHAMFCSYLFVQDLEKAIKFFYTLHFMCDTTFYFQKLQTDILTILHYLIRYACH